MCSSVSNDTVGTCVEECTNDMDCQGESKCCQNGCGGHACSEPIQGIYDNDNKTNYQIDSCHFTPLTYQDPHVNM